MDLIKYGFKENSVGNWESYEKKYLEDVKLEIIKHINVDSAYSIILCGEVLTHRGTIEDAIILDETLNKIIK